MYSTSVVGDTDTTEGSGDNHACFVSECGDQADLGYEISKTSAGAVDVLIGDESELAMIYNEPNLMNLTITKKVQGAYAPGNSSEETIYYPMTIVFHDGYNLPNTPISSNGAVTSDDSSGKSVFNFELPKDGSITFPIKEGVGYSVYEESDDSYDQYYTMTGSPSEILKEGKVNIGIEATMTTTSALTVLNQYAMMV